MNPNDKIRAQLLWYFYERAQNARGERGKHGAATRISTVRADMKARASLKQQEVNSNLLYLVDMRWVKKEIVPRAFMINGTIRSADEVWYRITARGMDKIEGDSEFTLLGQRGITVTTKGDRNVITVGNLNNVTVDVGTLRRDLRAFREAAGASELLSDDAKREARETIEALDVQLSRSDPDRSAVKRLWGVIEKLAVGTDLAQFVIALAPTIASVASIGPISDHVVPA